MKGLFCMEEIPNKNNYWILATILDHYTRNFDKLGIPNFFSVGICKFERGSLKLIFKKKEFVQAGKFVFNKLLSNPSWFADLNKQIFEINKDFMRFSKQILQLKPFALSDLELVRHLKRFFKVKDQAHFVGQPALLLDFDTPFFTNYLLDYLKTKTNNANEIFVILTTPTNKSFAQVEEQELLKIAKQIKKDEEFVKFFKENSVMDIERNLFNVDKRVNKLIHEHFKSFRWLCYMYEGPAYEKDYFIERLKGILDLNVEKEIKKIDDNLIEIKKQQEKLFNELDIDEKHKKLLELAKDTVFLKGFRKDCMFFGSYCVEELSLELAKRLDIDVKYLRHLLLDEIEKAVIAGKIPREIAKKRYEKSVYLTEPNGYKVLYDKEADELLKELEEQRIEEVDEIKGQCACSGLVKGRVKIINLKEDMSKMEHGDILVSVSTNPDLVPAMEKAAAFVTDMGGITCHAAIVAREMDKPCVIGTKIATKVLKDGDIVEVDAEKGVVRKVK